MATVDVLLVVMTEMLDELMLNNRIALEEAWERYAEKHSQSAMSGPRTTAAWAQGRDDRIMGVSLEDSPYSPMTMEDVERWPGRVYDQQAQAKAWVEGWIRRDILERALEEARGPMSPADVEGL